MKTMRQVALTFAIAAMCSSATAYAAAPTTIVYAQPKKAERSYVIMSNGSLSEQKVWQDRVKSKLQGAQSLKLYTFFPSVGRAASKDELDVAIAKLEAANVTTSILLQSVPLAQGTECQTSTADRFFNMPELGQQSTTTCNAIDDWIFRITIAEVFSKRITAVSELRASEQGIFEGWGTDFGASRAKQMIDRMMKSLTKAGAL